MPHYSFVNRTQEKKKLSMIRCLDSNLIFELFTSFGKTFHSIMHLLFILSFVILDTLKSIFRFDIVSLHYFHFPNEKIQYKIFLLFIITIIIMLVNPISLNDGSQQNEKDLSIKGWQIA